MSWDFQIWGLYILGLTEGIGIPIFFLTGIYIAVSPCLFPIMPLTFLRIFSEAELSRKRASFMMLLLVAGIVTSLSIFLLLVSTFQILANWLSVNFIKLSAVFGIVLILVGSTMIFPRLKLMFATIPIPFQEILGRENYSEKQMFLLGLVYTLIALPCAAPAFIQLSVIALGSDPLYILLGMVFFTVGVSLPYLALGISTNEARDVIVRKMARGTIYLERIIGGLVILFGILLIIPFFGGPILYLPF